MAAAGPTLLRVLAAAASDPGFPEQEWPAEHDVVQLRNALKRHLTEMERAVQDGAAVPRRARRKWMVAGLVGALLLVAFALVRRPPVWRVTYFRTATLNEAGESDLVRDLGGNWGSDAPHDYIPRDNHSDRWESCFVAPHDMELALTLGSDDGARLAIDGRTIIDDWSDHAYEEKKGLIQLRRGAHYVRVEHYDHTGESMLRLRAATGDGGAPAPLPPELLRLPRPGRSPCDPSAPGSG
jgi:hypothetical protein